MVTGFDVLPFRSATMVAVPAFEPVTVLPLIETTSVPFVIE